MTINLSLRDSLILWIVAASLIFVIRWRKKVSGSGLLLAYILNLGTIHWIAASLYVMPWWNALWFPAFHLSRVENGFKMSTYGILAFTLGSLLFSLFLIPALQAFRQKQASQLPDPRLSRAYLLTGLACCFILTPLLGRIPTVAALISSGLSLAATGLALSLWKAWQDKRRRKFYRSLALGIVCFPFLTMIFGGFLGFGLGASLTVVAFAASFYRPPWRLLLFGFLLGYLGLSFYVTYMRDRNLIREVVWGRKPLLIRAEQLYRTFSTLEWFNLYNEEHLRLIEGRLNQNFLEGAAIEKLSSTGEYVRGETLLDALLAFIPRAVWPNKPIRAGSGNLTARFTGLEFAEGTAVGIGQVMEFYVNFGTLGVFGGFLCMGALVTLFDSMAREHLLKGDWQGFTLWFLPGLSLMQVGGSLVEVTASAGGAVILACLVNRFLYRFKGRRLSAVRP